jgi:hypothetical protein
MRVLEPSNSGPVKGVTEFAEASPPRALPRTLRYPIVALGEGATEYAGAAGNGILPLLSFRSEILTVLRTSQSGSSVLGEGDAIFHQ